MRAFTLLLIWISEAIDYVLYNLYFKRKQARFEARILTPAEKLGLLNIEGLEVCYGTSTILNFAFEKAELLLLSNKIKGFEVKDVIIHNKSIYIKFKFSIPFNNGVNEYGSCFSINHFQNDDTIKVYGYNTFISNEKDVFYSIANEIINEFSK